MELMKNLAKGYDNKRIADIMCITTDTVKAHLTSILRKFDVTNRTEAVIYAIKYKVIPIEEL